MCAGHYGNDLAVFVFCNVHIVSKSHTEFSFPIRAFMELHSYDNLPCSENLALRLKKYRF